MSARAFLAAAEGGGAPDSGVAGWVLDLLDRLGGPGAWLAMTINGFFPPLASELVLPLAGFTASRGELTLAGAIFWTTLGSLTGALIVYGLGALIGRERLRGWIAKVPLVSVKDLDRAEAWFERHGNAAVFLARMVPLIRNLVSIPAGAERMSLPLFVLLTAAGSLIWNTAFVTAGYSLGANWERIERYAQAYQVVVFAVVLIGVVVFVRSRLRRRRRAGELPDGPR